MVKSSNEITTKQCNDIAPTAESHLQNEFLQVKCQKEILLSGQKIHTHFSTNVLADLKNKWSKSLQSGLVNRLNHSTAQQ